MEAFLIPMSPFPLFRYRMWEAWAVEGHLEMMEAGENKQTWLSPFVELLDRMKRSTRALDE
jgi:hypothetical protein